MVKAQRGGGWKQRLSAQAPKARRFLKKSKLDEACARPRGRPSVRLGAVSSALANQLRVDFLKNEVPANKIQRLAEAAECSGATGVSSLASCSSDGNHAKNLARDLGRRIFNADAGPPLYWVDMPDGGRIPVILPHEALAWFLAEGLPEAAPALVPPAGTKASEVLHEVCGTLGLDARKTTPLALWGDAVPFSKKKSVFVLTMSFVADPAGPRLPLVVLPGKGKAYREPLFEVILWSTRCLLVGAYPETRHTGEGFCTSDSRRASWAKQPLPQGVLTQLKGDWEYLANCLGLPSWASSAICWSCTAGLNNFKDLEACRPVSSEAFFAQANRLQSHLSSILSCPGVTTATICQDWLHTVDLGVGQSVVGAVFWEALETKGFLPGSSRALRLEALWSDVKAWYQVSDPPSRLDQLTLSMIKPASKDSGAYLHSKAAECRGLQGFLVPLASRLHTHCGTPHSAKVLDLCSTFWAMVRASTVEGAIDLARAKDLALEVHDLLVQLEQEDTEAGQRTWHVKPKLHQLVELARSTMQRHGPANLFWCYIDESYGGVVAKRALQRGGKVNLATQAQKLLVRIYSLQEFN